MKSVYILSIGLGGGGAERQISLLAEAIPALKLLLMEDTVEYEVDTNKVTRLSSVSSYSKPILKLVSIPEVIVRFVSIVKRSDTVLSFMTRANLLNICLKVILRHRAIISERTNPRLAFQHRNKRLLKWCSKLAYRYADRVVVNSTAVRQILLEDYRLDESKVIVVPNMLDLTMVNELSKVPMASSDHVPDRHTLVAVGRLIPAKGHRYLLEAFSSVISTYPKARLLILGKGPLQAELQNLAKELSISTHVEFLGFSKNPYKTLKKARGYVLSSLWEGFPNSLIEAMACGVPVIAADCVSGPSEILAKSGEKVLHKMSEEKYGILVPSGEVNQDNQEMVVGLADAMLLILNNDALAGKYAKKSLERASDFEVGRVINMWKQVLR